MTDYKKFIEEETVEMGKTVGFDMVITDLSGGINQNSTLKGH